MPHLILNPRAERDAYSALERSVVGADNAARVREFLALCPRYMKTPLRRLQGLSSKLKLGSIDLKDESGRFGLGSFKALGAPYALAMALKRRATALDESECDLKRIVAGDRRGQALNLTTCCASDGNHGRALAFAARHFGVKCVVFVHERVSAAQREGIAFFGADVAVVAGTYDDSVEAALSAAARHDWLLIADTSASPDDSAPRDVMQGYSILVEECLEQAGVGEENKLCPWTHVFVQAGVGGIAAAVAGVLSDRHASQRPTIVIVEPTSAACVAAAIQAGRPVRVTGDLHSSMVMLSCGEASASAWTVLQRRVDFCIAIEDAYAARAVGTLAALAFDLALGVGESGAAGLGGLIAACEQASWRSRLGLDRSSRVLLIGTEGAGVPCALPRATEGK